MTHLGWTSTAAVGSLQIHRHAAHPSIPASSRELAPGPTAMLLMMAQALLHARLMSMPSSFVPMPMGNTAFSHPNVFSFFFFSSGVDGRLAKPCRKRHFCHVSVSFLSRLSFENVVCNAG